MSAQQNFNPTLEIGHVLFLEIVGYSSLSSDQQTQTVERVRKAIRTTEELRRPHTQREIIQLATSNGMALVFFHDATAPLRCAHEVARLSQSLGGIKLRMGIHSGPVYRSDGITEKVAGEGVSQSQRIMECGDAGHILLSGSTADILPRNSEWQTSLHELGKAEIEPGLHLQLFNSYTDEVGNPNTPTRVRLDSSRSGTESTSLIDARYRLLEKLGEGGMGLVYMAEDTRLDRHVALKLLSAGHDDEHYRSRFYREARAASRLNHPYIATIYDYGTTAEGQPFIVMELVRGQTLASLLKVGPIPVARAIEIVAHVAEALDEAHQRGIIHRDIKPANVVIGDGGKVKVLDFGLAKEVRPTSVDQRTPASVPSGHTLPGVILGTPLYLSPEQARGGTIDARSDLFALGSLLYECLTGRPAFAGASLMEICANVIHCDPPPPSKFNPLVPAALDRINLKALAKEPQARYQSAADLLRELREVDPTLGEGEALTTKLLPPVTYSQTQIFVHLNRAWRSKYLVPFAALSLLVIGLSIWVATRYSGTGGPARQPRIALDWYDRGTQSLRDGAYFQASKMLEQAVKNGNAFALAHARLAEAYMELDVTDRARQEMLSAEEGREGLEEADRLHLTAIKATVQRDFPKAVEAYQELQVRNPGQQGINVDLGRAYQKNYEIDKAIESYERATQVNAQDAAAFLHLGSLYGRKRDAEKALGAFAKAQSVFEMASNSEGQAEVLYQRGLFYNRLSKYKDARANLEEALNIARDNKHQQVRILLQMSLVACFVGEPEQSQKSGEEAVEMARANALNVLTAQALVGLGSACQCAGRNAEAGKYFEEGLILARRHEAQGTEAKAHLSLGSLQIGQGKTGDGLQNVQSALVLYQKLGGYLEEPMSAQALIGRGSQQTGEYQAALDAFADLLNRAEQLKDLDHIAFAREGLGTVMLLQERYPEALAQYQASLTANESKGDQLGVGFALSNCGNALWRLGRYEEARRMFDQALGIARSPRGYQSMLVEIQTNRLEEALSLHDFSSVSRIAAEVLSLADPKDLGPVIKAKRGSALARLNSGKTAEAEKLCDEAVAHAIDLGDPALLYSARSSLAEVLLESQDASKALEIVRADLNHFVSKDQQESLWRAYVTAARASQQLGDESNARSYARQGRESLARIEHAWGSDAYQKYVKRPDVISLLGQLKKLTA